MVKIKAAVWTAHSTLRFRKFFVMVRWERRCAAFGCCIHLIDFVHGPVIECGYPTDSDILPAERGFVSYHGSVTGHYQYGYGSLLKYTCNDGYLLVGRKTRRCQANRNWEGKPPRCESEYCTQ